MLENKELNDILIANKILNLLKYKQDHETDFLVYVTFKDKKEIVNKININQTVEELAKNINPFTFVIDKKRKSLLLTEIIEYIYDEDDLIPILNNINKENISEVPYKYLLKILETACNYQFWETVECLFKNGFILKQGETNEVLEFQLILDGNYNFLKTLFKYQPDFDFRKKYLILDNNHNEDHYKTLLEALVEKQSLKKKHINIQETSKKNKFNTTIDMLLMIENQQLYNNLNETTENNNISKKIKI